MNGKSDISVLFVEDEKIIQEFVTNLLKKKAKNVYSASNGVMGLDVFKKHKPDLVMTDIRMPEMDGLEMIKKIKEESNEVKTIVVSAYSDVNYFLKAIDIGVQGFLLKPIDRNKLYESFDEIKNQIELEKKLDYEREKFKVLSSSAQDAIIMMDNECEIIFWNKSAERMFGYSEKEILGKKFQNYLVPSKYYSYYNKAFDLFRKTGTSPLIGKIFEYKALRKDKYEFPVELSLSAVRLNDKMHSIAIIRDISKRKKIEESLKKANQKLRILSRTDYLTKTSNRWGMLEKIEYEKIRFKRNKREFSIAIADIDDFKSVNDKYGHNVGDQVLIYITELINSKIRGQDILGRWGGEEFILMLPDTSLKGGKIITERIRERIETNPYIYKNEKINITLTLGLSVYDKIMDIDECIKKADNALYEGKKRGKNCVVLAK